MNATTKVLAINGSYRENGITDQAIAAAARALQESGAQVETITLRDKSIDFCVNCRACTQQAGISPGECMIDDGMAEIIDKIEAADAYVLAAPTNFGSATAIFKRFMERLTVYGYWPWGAMGPKFRKQHEPQKKALLITSCAAPGIMGRLVYATPKQLRYTAKIIGAKPVGTVNPGLVAQESGPVLKEKFARKTEALARKLLH
jgi:multimeric flavodoxin WrbA